MAEQIHASHFGLLRRKQVEAETGYSRSTIYLRMKQGLWTKAVNLGGRLVGWPVSEVQTLNAARIAGLSDAEIRELVTGLENQRSSRFEAFR